MSTALGSRRVGSVVALSVAAIGLLVVSAQAGRGSVEVRRPAPSIAPPTVAPEVPGPPPVAVSAVAPIAAAPPPPVVTTVPITAATPVSAPTRTASTPPVQLLAADPQPEAVAAATTDTTIPTEIIDAVVVEREDWEADQADQADQAAIDTATDEAGSSVATICDPPPAEPSTVTDGFVSLDPTKWWFGANQSFGYLECGTSTVRSVGSGWDWAAAMSRPGLVGDGSSVAIDFKVDNGMSEHHVGVTTPDYRNRLVLLVTGGEIVVQTQKNNVWNDVARFPFALNQWHRVTFTINDEDGMIVDLVNVATGGRFGWVEPMPTDQQWRFLQGIWRGTAILDNYVERAATVGPSGVTDLVLYGDDLTAALDVEDTFTRTSLRRSSPVQSGTRSMAVSFQQASSFVRFRSSGVPINTSPYRTLSFWVFATRPTAMQISVTDNLNVVGPALAISVTPGAWTEVRVPLVSLGEPTAITAITLENALAARSSPIYLDNITLVA